MLPLLILLLSVCGLIGCAQETPQPSAPSPPADQTTTYHQVGAPNASVKTLLDCLMEESHQVVAGHRGSRSGNWPENSLIALQKTLEQVPVLFEIDVAATKDSDPVVFHDTTLARTTTGRGEIADISWSYLRSVHLETEAGPTPFRVSLLADILAWGIPHSFFQIDIKRSARYEDVIRVIRQADASHRVILITYTPGQARVLARKAPDMMLSINVTTLSDLEAYFRLGLDPSRLVAWTGRDATSPALARALDQYRIAQIKGVIRRKGLDSPDQKSLEGATVIVSDFPVRSYRSLAQNASGACSVSEQKQ